MNAGVQREHSWAVQADSVIIKDGHNPSCPIRITIAQKFVEISLDDIGESVKYRRSKVKITDQPREPNIGLLFADGLKVRFNKSNPSVRVVVEEIERHLKGSLTESTTSRQLSACRGPTAYPDNAPNKSRKTASLSKRPVTPQTSIVDKGHCILRTLPPKEIPSRCSAASYRRISQPVLPVVTASTTPEISSSVVGSADKSLSPSQASLVSPSPREPLSCSGIDTSPPRSIIASLSTGALRAYNKKQSFFTPGGTLANHDCLDPVSRYQGIGNIGNSCYMNAVIQVHRAVLSWYCLVGGVNRCIFVLGNVWSRMYCFCSSRRILKRNEGEMSSASDRRTCRTSTVCYMFLGRDLRKC